MSDGGSPEGQNIPSKEVALGELRSIIKSELEGFQGNRPAQIQNPKGGFMGTISRWFNSANEKAQVRVLDSQDIARKELAIKAIDGKNDASVQTYLVYEIRGGLLRPTEESLKTAKRDLGFLKAINPDSQTAKDLQRQLDLATNNYSSKRK